jgi:hypothetical protein
LIGLHVTSTSWIILKVPDDWIPWLEMVKSNATTGQVWEYGDISILIKMKDQIPDL